MKQFLLNIWNAQRNARRVKELEIQVEILSFPGEMDDTASTPSNYQREWFEQNVRDSLAKQAAEYAAILRGERRGLPDDWQQRNLGNMQQPGMENRRQQ